MKRGLYIHIPFCKQKCNYCDFASFAGKEALFDDYLEAMAREAALYKGLGFKTLYVGGGTPSLLAEHQLRRLAKIIHKNSMVFAYLASGESQCTYQISVVKVY